MSTATLQVTTTEQFSQAPPTNTMKAAVLRQFGEPDVLQYEEIDTPKAKPGNIVIKVLAAGINRLDHYLREGSVAPDLPLRISLEWMPWARSRK